MTFDLQRILESKRRCRQELAARPIVEKLAMLDALRERAIALRGDAPRRAYRSPVVREESPRFGDRAGGDVHAP